MSNPFFSPKGVAVIGASQDSHKLGYGVVRNLINYRFNGEIYPVNEHAYEILGKKTYKRIAEVPDPLDLAVIIVPAPAVSEVLKECGERGLKHVVVVTGGFRETGEDGLIMEEALTDIAGQYGMRMIGPNCIGTIDTHTPVNTTFVVGMPAPGEIGFISHSGAMVAAIIDWAEGSGIGFSRIVSLGNQIDVNETDMIEAISEDPQTKVLTGYIEGVSNGEAFMRQVKKAARTKPFLILKGGQGASGAKAVASHTGALAGSNRAFKSAFEHCGIQEASTIEEMFEWARAMAWQPLPKGKRVAVLTNAGGPAILAVDALERVGLEIATLKEETKNYIKARLPKAASVDNPVDVLAGSGPATYTLALEALLEDDNVDAVVVIQAPQDWFLPVSLAEVVGEVAAAHSKTVITSLMGKASIGEALKVLQNRRIPNVAFPERSAPLLAAMLKRKEWLAREDEDPIEFEKDGKNGLDKERQKYIADKNWEALIQSYGIRLPEQHTVRSLEDAVKAFEALKTPVALKLISDKISHKTEVGGVKLDLSKEQEVRKAWAELEKIAKEKDVPFEGALVQQMIPEAPEVIAGLVRDAHFGPMILFGSGGTDVELFKDINTAIGPLNRGDAIRLIQGTKAGIKLEGWRNDVPGDKEAVIKTLMALGQIGADYPDIEELEINPLRVMPSGQGAYALDIRGSLNTPA